MKNLPKLLLLLPMIIFFGCKQTTHEVTEADEPDPDTTLNKTPQVSDSNPKPISKNRGVGPVENVTLGKTINKKMAEKGKKLFNKNCTNCHKLHDKSTAPALGGVTKKRSPEFIMNMILNPKGMLEHSNMARSMINDYDLRMVDKDLTREQARKILEYLRTY